MVFSIFSNTAPAVDWADAVVNQTLSADEPDENEGVLKSLMLRFKRTKTSLRKDQQTVAFLKENNWLKPKEKQLFEARAERFSTKIASLKAEIGLYEKGQILDRVQTIAEISDLFLQGTNTVGTLGISAARVALLGQFLNGDSDWKIKNAKTVEVVKQVAKAGTKLLAKTAFDYLFPTVSPYVSYAVLNFGENACSMAAEYFSGEVKSDQVKKQIAIIAAKMVATLALAGGFLSQVDSFQELRH